jgi:hypothetical protein
MFKSGWVRLWVVVSIVWLVGIGVLAAYYVWGRDACFNFESVSIADAREFVIAPQDKTLAESIKNEVTTKVLCGTAATSPLLTLEGLAERGAVKQVAFQWLGPQGWSMPASGWLDIADGDQIQAAEIIHRVSADVHRARLWYLLGPLVAALILPPILLLLGIGIAWVRRGFAS